MEHAELDADEGWFTIAPMQAGRFANIQNVAVTMLIFLDREDMIFRRIG